MKTEKIAVIIALAVAFISSFAVMTDGDDVDALESPAVGVQFYDTDCDQGIGLKFEITVFTNDSETGTYEYVAKVIGIRSPVSQVYIPDTIGYMDYTFRIDSIADKAFYRDTTITSVSMSNIESIGVRAFAGCSSLENVNFLTVESTDEVSINIGNYAFANCTSLTGIELTNATIGNGAFGNCTAMTNVYVGNVAVVNNPFYGLKFYTPDGVIIDCQSEFFPNHAYYGSEGALYLEGPRMVGVTFEYDGYSYEITSFDSTGSTNYLDYTDYNPIIENTIYGTAMSTGFASESSGITHCDLPANIYYEDFRLIVTAVESKAFYGDESIQKLSLPWSMDSVGSRAFANCTNLADVTLGTTKAIGNYAFYNTAVGSFSLDYVTDIGTKAFYGLSLPYIVLSEDLNTLGEKAFGDTQFFDIDGETQLTASAEDLKGYGYVLRDGKYVRLAPEGYEFEVDGLVYTVSYTYEDGGYAELTGYTVEPTSLVIPEYVEFAGLSYRIDTVGEKAFYGCTSLKQVDASHVERIGVRAFANSGVTEVDFGETVYWIERYAFYGCDITSLELTKEYMEIEDYAFSRCTSIERVSVPSYYGFGNNVFSSLRFYYTDGVTPIDPTDDDFVEHVYSGTGRKLVMESTEEGTVFDQGLLKYKIISSSNGYLVAVVGYADGVSEPVIEVPATVNHALTEFSVYMIGDRAFYRNQSIQEISIGENVEVIGVRAFTGSTLAAVDLGNVMYIESYAFYGCPIVSISIPASMSFINSNAFGTCNSVQYVEVFSTSMDSTDNSFGGMRFYETNGTTRVYTTDDGFYGHAFAGTYTKLVKLSDEPGTEFEVGDLKYRITYSDETDGTVEVIGYADGCSSSELVVPKTVKYGAKTFDVDTIANKAFYNNKSIKSINLGDVRYIEARAFAYSSLENVVFSDELVEVGNYSFFKCPLEKLDLPSYTEYIGISAFSGCTTITYLSIGYTEVDTNAFNGLTFYYPDGIEAISPYDIQMFEGHVYTGTDAELVMDLGFSVGDVFTDDEAGAKFKITSLTWNDFEVEIVGMTGSDGILSLSDYPCVLYKDYEFEVTAVGYKAFYKNSSIVCVELPDTVTKIGNRAFTECPNLTTVIINGTNIVIENYAFYKDTAITHLEFGETIASIGTNAFQGLKFYTVDMRMEVPQPTYLEQTPENLQNRYFEGDFGYLAYLIY